MGIEDLWRGVGEVLNALNAFWQWIANGVIVAVVTGVVAIVVYRTNKRWDERRAEEIEREKAASKEKRSLESRAQISLRAARLLTRWQVTKHEVDPNLWVLTNHGRNAVRHLCVGVYPDGLNKADNLSFELGTVASMDQVLVRMSNPAQVGTALVALSWSDSSPTEQFQTLALADAVRL